MPTPTETKIVVIGKVPTDLGLRLSAVGTVSYIERSQALSEAEMIAALKQATIVMTEPPDTITPKIIAACPQLIMIAQRAVGFDNINLKDCSSRPILVTNTPGVLDNATADLAFALLLAAGRRIVEADHYVRSGQWQGFENDLLLGCEMNARTIGIIGMGRIGSAVAKRAHGFGMNIIYCRAAETNSAALDNQIELDQKDLQWQSELGAKRVSFNTLLEQSDFISLHCPHNKQTEKLIGQQEFAMMKQSAIFINTARGKIVDEEALVKAIESKQIRGAGLDVFFNEPKVSAALLKATNVVLAPHIGSASEQTRYAMAELSVRSVELSLSGKLPANTLNPEVFDTWHENHKHS
ncbi:D-glycerate dehydrogenase [soil metagenome]